MKLRFSLWFSLLAAGLLMSLPAIAIPAMNLHKTQNISESPERTVHGHTLFSMSDPETKIKVPASAAYVGADRWILKKYADDIELHAFVDADANKQVQRLYWIQFERYLPTRPDFKHIYNSKRHAILDGMDFYVDTWVENTSSSNAPGSDEAHLKSLLHAAGYQLPKSMLTVRFVHLMNHSRKEMMLIYSENISATGFTANELKRHGSARGQWRRIERGLIEQAEHSIRIY